MSNGNENSSSVGIVAIVAILLLVGLGAWFMFGRGGRTTGAPRQVTTPAPTEQKKSGVDVKVNLPDSINIHR